MPSARRLLASVLQPLGNPEAQKPAAAARTNGLVAARLGPSERYSDESQTAARGSGRHASLVLALRPTEATISIAHRLGAAPVPAPPRNT